MLADCKCGTNVEAKLDVKNDKVVCTACFEEIEMSSFFKKMMKDRGEIYERRSLLIPPGGLQFICDNKKCNETFSAEVRKKDGFVYCPHCQAKAGIAPISLELLKTNLIFEGHTDEYYERDKNENATVPNEDEDETPKAVAKKSATKNKTEKKVVAKKKTAKTAAKAAGEASLEG